MRKRLARKLRKNAYLFLIALVITIIDLRAQSPGSYTITGVIKGIGNQKVLLGNKPNGYATGFKIIYFDSCFARNDSFSFKGRVKEPNFYSIEVAGQGGWCHFILENSKIFIQGNKDSIWKARVTGSKQNDIYMTYRKSVEGPYNASMKVYRNKIVEARKTNDSISIGRFNDSLQYYNSKLQAEMLRFGRNHPSSFVSLYNLNDRLVVLNIDTAKKYYKLLDKTMQNHSLGKQVYHEIYVLPQLLTIDHQIANFSLPDSNNKTVNLTDYRGKYVLLDFWASWCGPCLEDVPKVKELYASYQQKGFDVIGITLDSDRNKWMNAVHKYNINWATLCDLNGSGNKVALLFGIKKIPTKLLIDPSGKLVLKDPSMEELKKYLSNSLD